MEAGLDSGSIKWDQRFDVAHDHYWLQHYSIVPRYPFMRVLPRRSITQPPMFCTAPYRVIQPAMRIGGAIDASPADSAFRVAAARLSHSIFLCVWGHYRLSESKVNRVSKIFIS